MRSKGHLLLTSLTRFVFLFLRIPWMKSEKRPRADGCHPLKPGSRVTCAGESKDSSTGWLAKVTPELTHRRSERNPYDDIAVILKTDGMDRDSGGESGHGVELGETEPNVSPGSSATSRFTSTVPIHRIWRYTVHIFCLLFYQFASRWHLVRNRPLTSRELSYPGPTMHVRFSSRYRPCDVWKETKKSWPLLPIHLACWNCLTNTERDDWQNKGNAQPWFSLISLPPEQTAHRCRDHTNLTVTASTFTINTKLSSYLEFILHSRQLSISDFTPVLNGLFIHW